MIFNIKHFIFGIYIEIPQKMYLLHAEFCKLCEWENWPYNLKRYVF